LVAADELQASFTGAEQRLGVFVLPLVLPKVFAIKTADDSEDESGAPPGGHSNSTVSKGSKRKTRRAATTGTAATKTGAADRHSAAEASGGGEGAAPPLFDAGNDSDDNVPAGFSFDWDAFKKEWGDTPFEDAVTAMFAEYAVFYGRIGRWTTSSSPPPMTLDEAKSLANHAAMFINKYVRPILGAVNTPKIHKVLRHVLGAIKMHGALRNCNTSTNEAGHKTDKLFYRRTSRATNTFTTQIARQSQGTQAVLDRNAMMDAVAIQADQLRRKRRSLARGGKLTAETKRSVRKLSHVPVGALAQRPGLARLASVLQLDPNDKLPVLNQVTFMATIECGTLLRQTVHSSMNYRKEGKRFDMVIYTVAGETPVIGKDGKPNLRLHYGEVRALLRYKEEDVAVVCDMEEVRANAGCPLAERECKRLKWAVSAPGLGDWSVTAVPLSRVRRVTHVVPDFSELSSRRGVRAKPARYNASLEQRRAMRYYENAFFPWD